MVLNHKDGLGEVFSNLAQLRLGQSESAFDRHFNQSRRSDIKQMEAIVTFQERKCKKSIDKVGRLLYLTFRVERKKWC